MISQNNKYSENEVLKEYLSNNRQYPSPALCQIEKNLTNYFSSAEYPYNEMQLYLENTNSIPHMNTHESIDSLTNKVGAWEDLPKIVR